MEETIFQHGKVVSLTQPVYKVSKIQLASQQDFCKTHKTDPTLSWKKKELQNGLMFF